MNRTMTGWGPALAAILVPPLVGVALHSAAPAAGKAAHVPPALHAGTCRKAAGAHVNQPLHFVANAGQVDGGVRYHGNGPGFGIYFTKGEAIFDFTTGSPARGRQKLVRKVSQRTEPGAGEEEAARELSLGLAFLGSNTDVTIEGRKSLPGKVNYLRGNDPSKWHTGLSTFQEVVYKELWPGIDMVFHGDNGRLKYDFVVQPGAMTGAIRLAYRGADDLSLDAAGNIVIQTPMGVLTDEHPTSFQMIAGKKVDVATRFVVERHGDRPSDFGFEVEGPVDARAPLIIDPGLQFSTFLGGSGDEEGHAIAVDASGNTYVTGWTSSQYLHVPSDPGSPLAVDGFPTTLWAFQDNLAGFKNAFVTKLDATGALVFSTYLGGNGTDSGNGIAVDGSGNIWVTGSTTSPDFPTQPSSSPPTSWKGLNLIGESRAFLALLGPTGTLLSSIYAGGSTGNGIAVSADSLGSASCVVTGIASCEGPYVDHRFVTRWVGDPANTPTYSVEVHGGLAGKAVAVDGSGNAYVAGPSGVTKLHPNGDTAYSRLMFHDCRGIAVDGYGSAYVTGVVQRYSDTSGPYYTQFVMKLSYNGQGAIYYTKLLSSSERQAIEVNAIAVDGSGNAYVTGSAPIDFTPSNGSLQENFGGGAWDAFVTKLDPTGAVGYATFLGGNDTDVGNGIAVDGSGKVYVTGTTKSSNFPTTSGALSTARHGLSDAFVTKLDPTPNPAIVVPFAASITLVPLAASSTGPSTLPAGPPPLPAPVQAPPALPQPSPPADPPQAVISVPLPSDPPQ